MIRAVVLVVLLLALALAFSLWDRANDSEADASVHVVATAQVTTTTSWSNGPPWTLPKGFGVKAVAKARTAPRARYRAAAVGSIPDLIRRVFARFGPAVAEQAVRVSGCETGGTYNPAVVNSSGHTGLFQLSPRYHTARAARLGFSWAQMREAEPNALVAADLYGEQGWGPWTCRRAA